MPVRHHYNPAAMHAIIDDPHGGTAKNMFIRAVKVQKQAKLNLQRHPQRVDTGALRASITIVPYKDKGHPAFRVGSPLKYARWVHDGTGLYGPHHQLIFPKTAKALVWEQGGKVHGARHTRGMPGNPFLADALHAAKL